MKKCPVIRLVATWDLKVFMARSSLIIEIAFELFEPGGGGPRNVVSQPLERSFFEAVGSFLRVVFFLLAYPGPSLNLLDARSSCTHRATGPSDSKKVYLLEIPEKSPRK